MCKTSSLKRSSSCIQHEPSQKHDEDTKPSKLNSQTGRPVRASAGKRTSLNKDYVESYVDTDLDEDDDLLSDDPEIIGDTIITPKPKKRRLSPPPPELSPEPESDLETDENVSGRRISVTSQDVAPTELSLTFNIPSGHVGPFVVKLDLASLSQGNLASTTPSRRVKISDFALGEEPANSASNVLRIKPPTSTMSKKKTSKKAKTGFLDLPPEIRNVIYRQVFISRQAVDFRSRNHFSHSAAFLSTCRTVYLEGTDILYGDNAFKLCRDARQRGNYWSDWREIGWKDVRRFLTGIGVVNLGKIRKLSITFEDPKHKDQHNPHFTNDDHLMDCLKLIATYGRLQTFLLAFHGKTMVKKYDTRFLDNLKAIRADRCDIFSDEAVHNRGHYGSWYGGRRVANVGLGLDKEITTKIQRKEKMYNKVEDEDSD